MAKLFVVMLLVWLGALPSASGNTLKLWFGPQDKTCSNAPRRETYLSGFCSNFGVCWDMAAVGWPDNERYMKWYSYKGKLYTGYWSKSAGGCRGTKTYLDQYSEAESKKLANGECADGFYSSGTKPQSAKLSEACVAGGNCASCVKTKMKSVVEQDCKAGAKDAVKSIFKSNVADVIAGAVSGELDSGTLSDLGSETVAAACETCIDAIVEWLKEKGPTTCAGSSSCNGVDYMAGFALETLGVSGECAKFQPTPAPTSEETPSPTTEETPSPTTEETPSPTTPRRRRQTPSPTRRPGEGIASFAHRPFLVSIATAVTVAVSLISTLL